MLEINPQKFILEITRAGFTAVELSKISKVSQVTLARFKAGTQKARPQTLYKICKALNCTPEDLI